MAPAMPAAARLLALGDSAWTVQLGTGLCDVTHQRVAGLHALVSQQQRDPLFAHVTDLVPSFCSLTVHFDPWKTDAPALGQRLLSLAQQGHTLALQGRQWMLPVCFDDDFAPDLAALCEAKGLTRANAIEALLGARLRVYLIGFQPGFAYMGGLPTALTLPRRATPRHKVPACTVAVASELCGVYPWDSPGGWNLLGRTPVRLFDAQHTDQPALLTAGDEVRWTAVDRATHDRLSREVARGAPRETFLAAAWP